MSAPVRARSRRRRVSRRRYLVRRAAVVAVVVGAGFGLTRVAGAIAGDEPASEAAAIITAPTTTVSASTVPGSDDVGEITEPEDTTDETTDVSARTTTVPSTTSTTSAPTTSTSTTTTTTLPAVPSAENPAKVLMVGDSFAGLWGPPLASMLRDTGVVQTEIDHLAGSGLARPRNFDWFAKVNELLPAEAPDVVVTSFGGNDFVPLGTLDGSNVVGDPVTNEEAWVAEYQQRAGAMMDLLGADGRTVIWVGIPNDPDLARTEALAIVDKAAKAAAAARPGVVFIDALTMFTGRDGNWAEYIIDPRDGQGKDVRIDDGYHINEVGGEIIAHYAAEAIRSALQIRE